MTKIIHPLGWEYGREGDPVVVIKALSSEMLGHRSDLQESAVRAIDSQERECLIRQAELLEKYAIALYAVGVQMDPTGYKVENMSGLIELAEKHKITLPDWMKGA